jgi:hypothetical protein
MRKTRDFIAGGIGAAALLAAGTLSASAAQSGDTTTTFTLNGGTLDIAVASNASLPGGNVGMPFVSGQIGFVTVTDNRGDTVSWTASAATTVFSNGIGTNSTGVNYNSGFVSKTGTVTPNSTGPTPLAAAPNPVVNGNSVVGNNTATWEPMLTVNLPPNALAGTYSGTITTSVA